MHITKLVLRNYRNFPNATLTFCKGVNTIIGENGSGKSNVFRAIRLLLDLNMLRAAYRLDESDFSRSIGDWRGHWIIISLEFSELSADESIQSLFLHGAGVIGVPALERATYNLIYRPRADVRQRLSALDAFDNDALSALLGALTPDDYEVVFTGKSDVDFSDDAVYKSVVGDFENVIFNDEINDPRVGVKLPAQLSVAKEISFTFVQALRDVVSDFQSNKTNPLLTLLKHKSGAIDPATLQPISDLVDQLNGSIAGLDDVKEVRNDILETIKATAGETYSPTSLSVASDLSGEADKLFQALKLRVGESSDAYEGAIHELSLGGANLIYLTLKLLEFRYQTRRLSIANFLLIEEPEAHIHTHVQKTLFDKIAYPDTQIIYSTHSTQISEVSNVEAMNILSRTGNVVESYQPANGLAPEDITVVQRYLDAVRCNLLFAKSVVLVEGDAEELLLPHLFKTAYGISLDELGISLINVRSTGFKNLAMLFHDVRIRKRCAIVTDLDATFFDVAENAADAASLVEAKQHAMRSAASGADRKLYLDAFANENRWVSPFYSPTTFEVEFVAAGNADSVVRALPLIYTKAATIQAATADLQSGQKHLYGWRALTIAKTHGKGWFALKLAATIQSNVRVPPYVLSAILFAYGQPKQQVWLCILRYRLAEIRKIPGVAAAVVAEIAGGIDRYEFGLDDIGDVKALFGRLVPTDPFNDFPTR